MPHKLHEFVPLFILYLTDENGQNPAQKHFEKTDTDAYTQPNNRISKPCKFVHN